MAKAKQKKVWTPAARAAFAKKMKAAREAKAGKKKAVGPGAQARVRKAVKSIPEGLDRLRKLEREFAALRAEVRGTASQNPGEHPKRRRKMAQERGRRPKSLPPWWTARQFVDALDTSLATFGLRSDDTVEVDDNGAWSVNGRRRGGPGRGGLNAEALRLLRAAYKRRGG